MVGNIGEVAWEGAHAGVQPLHRARVPEPGDPRVHSEAGQLSPNSCAGILPEVG
jgi:hypothetical protein